jgi:uncharacterized protein YbaA (DUF1428 family)
MSYVDGFVCAVPMANRGEVRTHAQAAVFKERGALKVVECWGDDVPDGKLTSFPMASRDLPQAILPQWITPEVRDADGDGAAAGRSRML